MHLDEEMCVFLSTKINSLLIHIFQTKIKIKDKGMCECKFGLNMHGLQHIHVDKLFKNVHPTFDKEIFSKKIRTWITVLHFI